ncbi:MAG: chemotaxis protein CheW [Chloroflexi bacterium]|nr:chemotaxis protein CheW [Chloroflexota bacterium]
MNTHGKILRANGHAPGNGSDQHTRTERKLTPPRQNASSAAATGHMTDDKLKAILAERAKLLARVREQQTGACTQLVVFVLANEKYGIPIEFIAEVQPLRDVTPVPCTPSFVVGVINIRGSIYSVIDVRSLFGVPPTERTAAAKVILVKGAGMELGILADDVKGAASVLWSDIKPVLASHAAAKEEFIRGVTQDMMTILNLDALLHDERIIVREEVV